MQPVFWEVQEHFLKEQLVASWREWPRSNSYCRIYTISKRKNANGHHTYLWTCLRCIVVHVGSDTFVRGLVWRLELINHKFADNSFFGDITGNITEGYDDVVFVPTDFGKR